MHSITQWRHPRFRDIMSLLVFDLINTGASLFKRRYWTIAEIFGFPAEGCILFAMAPRGYLLSLYLSPILAVALFASANLLGTRQFWGFNFLRFFDDYASHAAVGASVLLALPWISRKLLWIADALSKTLCLSNNRRIFFCAVTAVVFFLLFLHFHSSTALLGDGNLRTNQIHHGRLFLETEILDFFLHALSFKLVFQPAGLNAVQCYNVISALCGIVFIIGVWRLSCYLSRDQSLILFLLMISSGVLVLFFGYVESYSLIAALLPYVTLGGLKVVDGKAKKTSYMIWCIAAFLVHPVSAFIFAPSLVIVLAASRDGQSDRQKTISRAMPLVLLALIIVAYTGRSLDIGNIQRYLMPLFAREEYRQGMFTVNHYLNLFNWLFLSALPFLWLGPYILLRAREPASGNHGRSRYALWIIVPSLCFMFFFTPQLGGPRDWDLFSLPAFALVPSILVMYLSSVRKPLPHQAVPLVFISLATTLGFAGINSSVTKSVDRFVEIVEVSRFKNLTKEYSTLVSLTECQPEIENRRLEFVLKAWRQPPYTRGDSLSLLDRLAKIHLEKGDKELAWQHIQQALAVDSLDINIHITLTDFLYVYGNRDDLLDMAELIERRFPDKALGQLNAGVIYLQLDNLEKGGKCLTRAYELDSEDFAVLRNYGVYRLQTGDYRGCIEIMRRAIAKNRKSFLAHYYTAVAYAHLGDTSSSKEYASKAQRLARSDRDENLLNDLRKRLK